MDFEMQHAPMVRRVGHDRDLHRAQLKLLARSQRSDDVLAVINHQCRIVSCQGQNDACRGGWKQQHIIDEAKRQQQAFAGFSIAIVVAGLVANVKILDHEIRRGTRSDAMDTKRCVNLFAVRRAVGEVSVRVVGFEY